MKPLASEAAEDSAMVKRVNFWTRWITLSALVLALV